MYARDDDVRRNFDGSIDFAFYRRRAARLRARAIREFFMARTGLLVKSAVAVGIIIAALLIMPADEGPGANPPPGHPAVTAQGNASPREFRRVAADRLGSAGLDRHGDRRQPTDDHP